MGSREMRREVHQAPPMSLNADMARKKRELLKDPTETSNDKVNLAVGGGGTKEMPKPLPQPTPDDPGSL